MFSLALASQGWASGSAAAIEKATRQLERSHGVTVRFDVAVPRNVKGRPLKSKEQLQALALLGRWLATYPAGYARRFIDDIVVVNDLVVDGIRARGFRELRRIYLSHKGGGSSHVERADLDHELFHAIDGYLGETDLPLSWEEDRSRALRLRNLWDDYRLSPSHRYTFSWKAVERKPPWIAYVPVAGLVWFLVSGDDVEPPDGFASHRGLVAPREDRATVAEMLMGGSEKFLRRAAGDRELREKVAIVRAIYRVTSLGMIGDDFWSAIADGPYEIPSLAQIEKAMWYDVPVTPTPPPRRASLELAGPPVVAVVERRPAVVVPPPAVELVREEPVVRQAPAPTPKPTPVPTPVPTPLPTPVPTPAVKKPPVRPAAASGSSPAAMYKRGEASFAAGAYPEAETNWLAMLRAVDASFATIQIAINCSFDNVVKNRRALNGKSSFFSLPYRFNGRDCHLSMTGLYRDSAEAGLAVAALPPDVQAQKPRVISVGDAVAAASSGR